MRKLTVAISRLGGRRRSAVWEWACTIALFFEGARKGRPTTTRHRSVSFPGTDRCRGCDPSGAPKTPSLRRAAAAALRLSVGSPEEGDLEEREALARDGAVVEVVAAEEEAVAGLRVRDGLGPKDDHAPDGSSLAAVVVVVVVLVRRSFGDVEQERRGPRERLFVDVRVHVERREEVVVLAQDVRVVDGRAVELGGEPVLNLEAKRLRPLGLGVFVVEAPARVGARLDRRLVLGREAPLVGPGGRWDRRVGEERVEVVDDAGVDGDPEGLGRAEILVPLVRRDLLGEVFGGFVRRRLVGREPVVRFGAQTPQVLRCFFFFFSVTRGILVRDDALNGRRRGGNGVFFWLYRTRRHVLLDILSTRGGDGGGGVFFEGNRRRGKSPTDESHHRGGGGNDLCGRPRALDEGVSAVLARESVFGPRARGLLDEAPVFSRRRDTKGLAQLVGARHLLQPVLALVAAHRAAQLVRHDRRRVGAHFHHDRFDGALEQRRELELTQRGARHHCRRRRTRRSPRGAAARRHGRKLGATRGPS
mmetsp:Transcript_964/g.3820  ORF Transcript_964/g.3820 Transcript_964/m.3820 type:complete len:532 (-) Transcript_964:13-1608(-)